MSKRALPLLLLLLLALLPFRAASAEGENLLQNGSFEQLDDQGLPVGWTPDMWYRAEGITEMSTSRDGSSDGQAHLVIANHDDNDARMAQTVAVEPESYYRLSGDIWAIGCYSEAKGANLTVEGIADSSEEVHDALTWRHVEIVGRTGRKQKELTVWCRLGGYGSENMGEAHFDNIKLEKLDAAPASFVSFEAPPVAEQPAQSEGEVTDKSVSHLVPTILMVAFLYAALCAWGYFWLQKRHKRFSDYQVETVLIIAMGVALAVRFYFGLTAGGHDTDLNCFKAWSTRVFDQGPWGFYEEAKFVDGVQVAGYFADYPPGYMLILYPIGALRALLRLEYDSGLFDLLVKMPAILCDIGAAYLVYRIAKKWKAPNVVAAALAIGLLFNPALIHNSSIWAQIDSVLALLLLLSTYWIIEKRLLAGSLAYVAAFLIKPQALMLGPSLLFVYIYALLSKQKPLKTLLAYIGICVAAFLAVCLPFWGDQSWHWILDKYFGTMGSYAYGSVNAFNLFAMLGYNWVGQETILTLDALTGGLFLILCAAAIVYAIHVYDRSRNRAALYGSLAAIGAAALFLVGVLTQVLKIRLDVLGHILIAAALLYAAYLFLRAARRSGSLEILPLIGAFVVFAFYVLEVRQHERYMFPMLLLLPLAYITLRDRRILFLFLACTVTQLLNSGIVLEVTHVMPTLPFMYGVMRVASAVNLILFGYMAHVLWGVAVRGEAKEPQPAKMREQVSALSLPTLRELGDGGRIPMKRLDYIVLAAITVVYSVVAFVNLGSTTAPQTEWRSTSKEETLVFDLGEVRPISRICYDVGICAGSFTAEVSYDGIDYTPYDPHYQPDGDGGYDTALEPITIEDNTMFRWLVHEVAEPAMGRYVRIQPQSIGLVFLEMAFTDSSGVAYPIQSVTSVGSRNPDLDPNLLIDEQATVPRVPSYYNGTYFDEIYHARTAYEMMHGMHWYETTHPPLGKAIIEIGIALFGMTPFGWRFSGTVVGILMIPVLYLILKVLFKRTNLAAAGTLLFTFDFMHFTQTRIATIDSYGVFFILLMYLFMFLYMKRSFFHEKLGRTLVPLFLCGLSMGLGIASKWIDIYAAVGLAILLFYTLFQRYLQYREACRELDDHKKVLSQEEMALFQDVRRTFWPKLAATLGACVVFFIAIPLAIYIGSYWQYFSIKNEPHELKDLIKAQEYMFKYHSGLTDDHPYASPWWEWLVDWKPMWYFSGDYLPEHMTSGISAFGNPAVWWFGLFALLWSVVRFVVGYGRKDKRYVWLLVGFAVNFLPWVLVPRSMFIYHYFASVPFLVLCTMMFFEDLQAFSRNGKRVMWGFVIVAIALFVLFYPATSGLPVAKVFARGLKWLPSWVLFSVS